MSERERWVVYPLLFLALGASLRDKLGGRLTAKSIVCQELVIEDEPVGNQPAQELVRLGRLQTNPNTPSLGGLAIKGEIVVDGAVNVNGVVNANQFAYRGIPIFPTIQVTPVPAPPARGGPRNKSRTDKTDEESTSPPSDSNKESLPARKPADEAAPQN